jgi:DNA-directed RNA polymerase specialized sigma24 family protein
MTLLEAFRILAPPVPTSTAAEQGRLEAAAVMTHGALQRLSLRVLRGHQEAEDIVQEVFCRLLQGGPRGTKAGGPASDAAVEGFLGTCLKNALRDRYRHQQRRPGSSLDDPDRRPGLEGAIGGGGEDPFDTALAAERLERLAEAEAILYGRALPDIARTRRDPASLMQTMRDIRDLSRGTLTMAEIVDRDQPEPTATTNNRLYQRHNRARREMLEGLTRWLEVNPLPVPMDEYVRRLAQEDLRPRVIRTGAT